MKSRRLLGLMLLLAFQATAALGQQLSYPKAKVNFGDYKNLLAEVEAHRARRLVDLDTFLEMGRHQDVLILDCRSQSRYERIHVKGAKHLAFTDFTQQSLAEVIPSFETTILIYCNNNFEGNPVDFAAKTVERPDPASVAARQLRDEQKPRMMALNVPTYINLYGYGYRHVYELDELVQVTDPRIEFEGSAVGPLRPSPIQPQAKLSEQEFRVLLQRERELQAAEPRPAIGAP